MGTAHPAKSHRPIVSLGDYHIMYKKFAKPKPIIEIDWTRYSFTPVISHDDPVLRKQIIRKQIKPFQPEAVLPKSAPLAHPANTRKVIDFQTAIISEPEKWHHISVMLELCERLAACWNTVVYDVNEASLYALFAHYGWTCPVTGKVHSWKTPLTIVFLCPVWQGGKIALANMQPRFMGWLPGEYRWHSKPNVTELAIAG